MYSKIKVKRSCCSSNPTRGHMVTLYCLSGYFVMLRHKNTVPWNQNLPCSSSSCRGKHFVISSSNWQRSHVTWTGVRFRKYLFISHFGNEFKAQLHLLAHRHYILLFNDFLFMCKGIKPTPSHWCQRSKMDYLGALFLSTPSVGPNFLTIGCFI